MCIHTGAPGFFLDRLEKLQKWVCRTFEPAFAASAKLLSHHRIVASLSLVYSYCFDKCSSELAKLVSLICPLVLSGCIDL